MANQNVTIELAEMIEGLRNELDIAQQKGKDKKIHFGVKDIELELNITIVKEVKVSGEAKGNVDTEKGMVKYLVGKIEGELSLDGEGNYQKVSSQKIKLNLSALNPDGTDSTLSGQSR